MRRLRWPAGRIVAIAAMVAGVLTALPASSLAAGDGIPRPPGAIENRGWELVSQADLNGNEVDGVAGLSLDGNRVQYEVNGGVDGSTTGARSQLLATRTSSGWASKSILPPTPDMLAETYFPAAFTPDLGEGIWSAFHGLGAANETPDMTVVRLDDQGNQTLLHTFQIPVGANDAEFVASDDLRHVYGYSLDAIDPSQTPGTKDVYDIGSGTPMLVSRMPATGQAPACGVPNFTGLGGDFGFAESGDTVYQHWTSTDGSQVFFATHGDTCTDPLNLYVRDVPGATTTEISGPPLPGDPDNGVDRFIGATADGSKVFFRTATSLDPADDADGNNGDLDIYRWTRSGGAVCLTCVVPNAAVSPSTNEHYNVAASEDGSHVYFTSPNQLADAPAAADATAPNLYVWRDDGTSHGTIHFIARVDYVDPLIRGTAGEVTPDGNVLVFRSHQPGLDALSGTTNGGFYEYYRYDDRDGSVTCISCPPGGATPTVDVPQAAPLPVSTPIMAPMHIVSDDGRTVVFSTDEALVPADVNDGPDLYEWHDGTVGLITSGTMQYGATEIPRIITISPSRPGIPSGRDILFEDYAPLTAEVQGGAKRLYDARIDGGFPPPPAPLPGCVDDACQAAPPAPPSLLEPPSLSFTGTGNVLGKPVRFSVARVTAAQRRRLARTGRLTLRVQVSAATRLSLVGQARIGRHVRVVARSAKQLRRAGSAAWTVRLSREAMRALARTGRLRIVLTVRCSNGLAVRRVVLRLSVPRRAGTARVPATGGGR